MTTDTNTNSVFKNTNGSRKILFAFLLFLCLLRFFAFGIKYYPYLDDYIQYGTYHLYSASYILKTVGTVYTRPLAALCDFFIWSHLNMTLSLIIIFAMHFLSAYFIDISLKKVNVFLSPVFFVFFFFTPFAFEGLYWLSASSRIISGIFFASLSSFFLVKRKTVLFAFFNIVSYCFYEQTMIFSVIFNSFIVFMLSKHNDKSAKNAHLDRRLYSIIFANALIVALYYIAFSKCGKFASRNEIHFSLKSIFKFYNLIRCLDAHTYFKVSNIGLILAIIVPSLIICMHGKSQSFSHEKLYLGIALIVLPMAPYFFLGDLPYLRNTVVFSIGAGLLFDSIPQGFFKKSLSFLLCLFFINAQINMLSNQKRTFEEDTKIMENLAPFISENSTYYLCGAKEKYHGFYNLNITSSDWALTGAMRFYKNSAEIKYITPISSLNDAKDENREIIFISDGLKISK